MWIQISRKFRKWLPEWLLKFYSLSSCCEYQSMLSHHLRHGADVSDSKKVLCIRHLLYHLSYQLMTKAMIINICQFCFNVGTSLFILFGNFYQQCLQVQLLLLSWISFHHFGFPHSSSWVIFQFPILYAYPYFTSLWFHILFIFHD